ncbi:unnamed protein product [Didymodactylos carnosus]|uniref:Prenyl transferase n=1 Tax=Didymodactylos carnosus TaxID=1234261 RepID=A0A814N9P4_9BILA|nr:unnamed protein product [Didymodactylos carnosus]CAF1089024.1 unnamed protein product [Didymodactylos carnosus]CAF3648406.1 unnamed protein product [Didymodactylos carnosus]CAF3854454.1 unnamed protein product [Didymodactylos carnosus]
MRLTRALYFLSSNGFYVHAKNKTPNWLPILSQGEKQIGYSSSLRSLLSLKYLFNEEVSTLVAYLRKLVGTGHPLLKLASNMLDSPPKTAHARSVLLLLISKAAGIPSSTEMNSTDIKHGLHENQRHLAEIIEMIHLGMLGHRGNLDDSSTIQENRSDLEQGNKLAVLGGDYLLSQACGRLADFKQSEVVETIGTAIKDCVKAEFYLDEKKSLQTLSEWYKLTALSVANLVAYGCRASLQLVNHSKLMQDNAYYLCRHIIFSCMMYNDISQYAIQTSTTDNTTNTTPLSSSSLMLYGLSPVQLSYPYSMAKELEQHDPSKPITYTDKLTLDKCREQCVRETYKGFQLLEKFPDQSSQAVDTLRTILQQTQEGVMKT